MKELPYAAVSMSQPEGRAAEWKGPLWYAVHEYGAASNERQRESAVVAVEQAVEKAMRLALDTAGNGTDMSDRARLKIARDTAHERADEIGRLERRLDNKNALLAASRERAGTQSAFIMKLLGLLSKHAPETLIKELVEEAALGANGAAKLQGISLYVAPKREGIEL